MKRMLTISFVLGALVAFTAAPARAGTKTWAGGTTGNWHEGNNWFPQGEPGADDDVIIEGEIMTQGITVYVTQDDDECRTVDLFYAKVIINGGILTIGEDGEETTSYIDDKGEIRFQDDSGTAQATLLVRNWVEFVGNDGRIIAVEDENQTYRPFIQRADPLEDSGIKVVEGLSVLGAT